MYLQDEKNSNITKSTFKSAIRKKNYLYSTDKLHDEFELLKIKDITKQEISSFVHNFFSNSLPPVFSGYFETLVSNHNRNTRNGYNLIKIKNHSTNFAAASIKIQGAKIWNKLDNKLKEIPKIKGFRKNSSLLVSLMKGPQVHNPTIPQVLTYCIYSVNC